MAVLEHDLSSPGGLAGTGCRLAAQAVTIVTYPGVLMLDAAQVLEVLSAAARAVAPAPGYDVLVTSPTGCSVPTSCGTRIGVDAAMRDVIGSVDTLVVLGGWDHDSTLAYPGVLPQVRRLGDAARRVLAVCNGGHLLRAAGLGVGPDSGTWVMKGGTELALWMVDQDYGKQVARTVVGWLGQGHTRESSATPEPLGTETLAVAPGSPLRDLADAVISNPAGDHSVRQLSHMACISERHLNRLFLSEMGMGPARFVQRVRVEAARAALERDSKPIETIAAECGFGTAETMRRAFLRVLGVSPSAYRRAAGCTQC
jgi:transcriptional regulator GlxA family with amidase domain